MAFGLFLYASHFQYRALLNDRICVWKKLKIIGCSKGQKERDDYMKQLSMSMSELNLVNLDTLLYLSFICFIN